MPDLQCLKIRIKDGKSDYAKDWVKGLTDRDLSGLNEVLHNEGMIVESIFFESGENDDYLILYQRADDLVKANEVFNNSTHPVDQAVREFIAETWADVQPLELLIDHERVDGGYVHKLGDE